MDPVNKLTYNNVYIIMLSRPFLPCCCRLHYYDAAKQFRRREIAGKSVSGNRVKTGHSMWKSGDALHNYLYYYSMKIFLNKANTFPRFPYGDSSFIRDPNRCDTRGCPEMTGERGGFHAMQGDLRQVFQCAALSLLKRRSRYDSLCLRSLW